MLRPLPAALACALALSAAASASERRFTLGYESGVLGVGQKELELWVTPRVGRDGYYARFDNRAELEWGLTERLQTALYLNFTTKTAGGPERGALSGSVSSEWKYKLLDPVADAVGLALYGELTGNLDELELEGKVILDKRVGSLLLTLNLVGEREFKFEGGTESVLAQSAGVAYLVTPGVGVGLEALHHGVYDGGRFVGSALFLGPTVSYAGRQFWVAGTFSPQVAAYLPKWEAREGRLELEEHERFRARLLLGFHL